MFCTHYTGHWPAEEGVCLKSGEFVQLWHGAMIRLNRRGEVVEVTDSFPDSVFSIRSVKIVQAVQWDGEWRAVPLLN